jgi:glutathione-regulated potassium-efflux system ancillary protein KefC
MWALPNLQANLDALAGLGEISFQGRIAATARYPDEIRRLQDAGATAVFNIYTEAGAGFANHVETQDTI